MDISLSAITKCISNFLHRFHVVIFGIVAIGGLAVAVFLLYQVIISATDAAPNESTSVNFDQQTIEALEELSDSRDNTTIKLPNGRINPFVE